MEEQEVKRLFIHIPKNGGTSVHYEIMVHGIKKKSKSEEIDIKTFGHDRWKDVPTEIRYTHQSFAVIRNPWARVISRYVMGIPTQHTNEHGTTWNTFEEFLETRHLWTDKEWNDPIRSWNTQYDYVCDEDNIVRCDSLRLEHIDDELIPYLQLDTKSIRKDNNKSHQDYYNNNSKSIQIVADWYAQDIDYWGFDFDTSATKNYHYHKEKKI